MKITIIDGHPDPDRARYGHFLAQTYADAARLAGHDCRMILLCDLPAVPLQSRAEQFLPAADWILKCQADLSWADHWVIIFPIWLGGMPAKLKAFFEQVARPQFAFDPTDKNPFQGKLRGRSARIIVTMGMPALFYRLFYFAHGVKILKRNILHFIGVSPVRVDYIGNIDAPSDAARKKWIAKISGYGKRGI